MDKRRICLMAKLCQKMKCPHGKVHEENTHCEPLCRHNGFGVSCVKKEEECLSRYDVWIATGEDFPCFNC